MTSLSQSDNAQPATTGPNAPNPSHPTVDYKQEVRFAVVMYGGVSLAIYINGVAQELLRWVRSTARHAKTDVALISSDASKDTGTSENPPVLGGTERVYRKLSYILSDRGQDGGLTAQETHLPRLETHICNSTSSKRRA